jgi:hypothetical protein
MSEGGKNKLLCWWQPVQHSDHADQSNATRIPATLLEPGALRFWSPALFTGIGVGVSAIILTRLLEIFQHLA